MTSFLGSYERARPVPRGEATRVGKLVGLSDDTMFGTVELAGESFELPVAQGKYRVGAYVSVLESNGKPRRVLGAATVRPEGLDEDAVLPEPVTGQVPYAPVEFTPADQAKVDTAVADLAEAQDAIADAVDRIGNLATQVGFSWSGTFEADYPAGSDFRVDWTALGGGEFRFQMVNIPTGANFGWSFSLPGEVGNFFPTTNPVVVTATEPGDIFVYAWADNENIAVDYQHVEVHPGMLEDAGPLQAAISAAADAAVRASRIAPRSLRTPTVEDGDNRPVGSVWTQVNAQGEELAYWAWDGEAWVPQALSTQVIPYLDAAHIKTGVLDSDRVNVTEIWAQIATIGRIITQDLIATGAVTAPALNVVHIDPETGFGWRADPEGLTFLDEDGNPAIVLRTDMANRINIVQDGAVVASISPDGEIVGQTITANQSLIYQGTELEDLLGSSGTKTLAVANLSAPLPIDNEWARVGHVTWTGQGSRRYRATLALSTNNETAPRVQVSARRSEGNKVESTNSLLAVFEHGPGTERNSRTHIFEFNSALEVEQSVGFFVRCTDGGTVTAMGSETGGATTKVSLEDLGPAVEEVSYTGYTTASGGSGSDDAPTKSDHTGTWNATGHKTYSYTSLTSTRAASWLVQGAWAGGNSRGHWLFNDADIRTKLSGATDITGTIKLRNGGTGTGTMTAVLRAHEYSSAPATFGTSTYIGSYTFTSGQDRTITLPSWVMAGLKDGSIRGFSLDHGGSTSEIYYGYFSPTATVTINYRK